MLNNIEHSLENPLRVFEREWSMGIILDESIRTKAIAIL